jgi:hypothetical protein
MLKFGDRLQIKDPMLKFEKWWLEVEEFARIVKKCWGTDCPSRDPLEVWQFKVRLLRRKLKSWSRNAKAKLRKSKSSLIGASDELDKLAEIRVLSSLEREKRREDWVKLDQIWRMDEIEAR